MSSEKLYVPQRFHAAIIGRGGKSISHLQSEYHCKVAVPKPHESSSLVVVSAKDAQNCHRVVEEIEKIIGFKASKSPLQKAFCHIPKSKYGALLGKQREVLNNLETSFACGIHVPFKDDPSEIVEIEGPKAGIEKAIKEMESLVKGNFTVDWGKLDDRPSESSSSSGVIDLEKSGPINQVLFFPDYDISDGWNFDIFLGYLKSAKKSIDACVFTITDDRISNLLVEKFQKGVKVRIITDNDTSNQQGSDITRFKKSGIPCKVDKSPFHMHNKFCVIDNVLVMNGSYNWTVSASTNNRENVMVTNFGVYVQEFSHEFERMWNDQKEFANF